MSGEKHFVFPPYSLDTTDECLSRGSEKIPLRPKSFAILRYLLENHHRLVPKEELIAAAWPKTRVVDAALKVSIREIRKALGDKTYEPRFIKTVCRKGYQFIAPISLRLEEEPGGDSTVPVVGRDSELEWLRKHLEIARTGKRQVLFITGEPGIGKTTLVKAFARDLPASDGIITAQGQCIEQYGAGEAYVPIFDALDVRRTGRSTSG
jgi:DNA-binding winged helix-turn-helix (wHTH) protein